MKPIGALMIEHRLIERVIHLLDEELIHITNENDINIELLTSVIDFIRSYADHTHHGKEEDILFKRLAEKPLSREHHQMMKGLIEDHRFSRQTTSDLADALDEYANGNNQSKSVIAGRIRDLVELYPTHIEKEDKRFFFPSLDYFSRQEQDDMLQEFWEFDRKLMYEKYRGLVEQMEKAMV